MPDRPEDAAARAAALLAAHRALREEAAARQAAAQRAAGDARSLLLAEATGLHDAARILRALHAVEAEADAAQVIAAANLAREVA